MQTEQLAADGVETTAAEVRKTVTRPGIYPLMSMDFYQKLDAASSHRLHALKRSPLHCRHSIDATREQTPALLMGSLVNAMLLEDAAAVGQFAVAEQCAGFTQAGKECGSNGSVRIDGEWYCKTHAKKAAGDIDTPENIVTQEVFDEAGACVLAIRKHPKAREFLDARTDTELSVVWEDAETGLLCKARPDFLIRPNVQFDLKTSRDIRRRSFEKSIFDYGYHTQAAHYRNGLRAHGIDITDAGILAVETDKNGPRAVAVYQFEDDVMDWGEREIRRLLRLYAKCKERNEWPGPAGEGVELIALPTWAKEYVPEIEAE